MSISKQERKEPAASEADGVQTLEHHGGTLTRRQGVHIVQLQGSYEEMGRQHAVLANEVCGDAVVQYFDKLIEKLLAEALPFGAMPIAALLKRYFRFRNARGFDSDVLDTIRGLSEEYGIRPHSLESNFHSPDIMHWIAAKAFVPLAVPPMCSSVYATGSATVDGKQLFARNFDFYGRNVYNTSAAFVVMRPNDGQRSCWMGALGMPFGPHGINESGLLFTLNTLFTKDVGTRGQAALSLAKKFLVNCTTLEEAIHQIESEPRLIGMAATIVDTKAGIAASIGYSANKLEVIPLENDVLVRTNHYLTPEMQETEVGPYPFRWNSEGRYRRIHQLLDQGRGALDPKGMTDILGDCMDIWEGEERVTGNIVAGVNTTQSLVFSPDDDAVWTTCGDHPVSHGETYAGFRLSALFDGDGSRYEREPIYRTCKLDEHERTALHEYADAWTAHFDSRNDEQAIYHLRRAQSALPGEPMFPRMAGILLMKRGRYKQALPLLKRNAAHNYRDQLAKAESLVWLGRCLDLMNRHTEAIAHYHEAEALNASPVSEGAQRHITKPFRKRELLQVAPEFICGTAFSKYRKN